MDEDTNKDVTVTDEELKAAAAKAAAERTIAYARAMEDADLGIKQSTVEYNNAAKWAALGIGVGVASIGIGALVYAVKS